MFFSKWSKDTKMIVITALIASVLVAVAIYSFGKIGQLGPSHSTGWLIWLSLAAGGLGGIVHEFFQSGGKLLLVKRQEDGIYLGGLTGVLLGIVAGVLAVQGLFAQPQAPLNANRASTSNASPAPTPTQQSANQAQQAANSTPSAPQFPIAIQAFYLALLAGLGLKGVAEAAGGQSVTATAGPLPPNARIQIDLPPTPQPPKLN